MHLSGETARLFASFLRSHTEKAPAFHDDPKRFEPERACVECQIQFAPDLQEQVACLRCLLATYERIKHLIAQRKQEVKKACMVCTQGFVPVGEQVVCQACRDKDYRERKNSDV
jgi:uncharacterized paraquat-inducible protein A